MVSKFIDVYVDKIDRFGAICVLIVESKLTELTMFLTSKKSIMVDPNRALAGRDTELQINNKHAVLGSTIKPPFAIGTEQIVFGLGCFWGAERRFWQQPGVVSTAVGYSAGYTPNPTYEEVCSGLTGHNEVVLVVFDPKQTTLEKLLALFWESHNPTQGMRQGNDQGTQYRSGIYTFNEQQQASVLASKEHYQQQLNQAGLGSITTEVIPQAEFYYAEEYHQQYLHKVPNGYCGLSGVGVSYTNK